MRRFSALKGLAAGALTLAMVSPALCRSDKTDDVDRINRAAQVFQDVSSMPDRGIPGNLLARAQCIGIVPGQKKFALGIGGQYGKGVVTCRDANGWSAPLFITIGGGSWGLQLGGSSTDVVMVFLNRNGVQQLLSNKFRIGADANAAAGPVGRSAAADTDVALHAQILTYSRSRGAFAGVSLNGSVVQPDDSGNSAMYGANARPNDILSGSVPVPSQAQVLVTAINSAAGQNAATGTAGSSTPASSSSTTTTTPEQQNSTQPSNTQPNTTQPNNQPNTTTTPPDQNATGQSSATPRNPAGEPNTGAGQPAGQAPSTTTPDNTTPPAQGQATQPNAPQSQQPPDNTGSQNSQEPNGNNAGQNSTPDQSNQSNPNTAQPPLW